MKKEILIDNLLDYANILQRKVRVYEDVLKAIRTDIQLSNISYTNNDYEEMKKINDELIEFINEFKED